MLEIKHLSKTYKTKHNEVYALKDINLSIQDKGMVFILGKSGSGKSTLLNVLGGLDSFDEGEISICGNPVKILNRVILILIAIRLSVLFFRNIM